jgi:glycosyltransferase involved in cell wall biosynthesis
MAGNRGPAFAIHCRRNDRIVAPMNPEISVVIPTRNRPAAVVHAVESVLAQTFRELEVTVVIDGPDEATALSIAKVQKRDARLHVIALERNVGGCGARNLGIQASRGRWIALLDDDDQWLPQKLEMQLAAVAEIDLQRTQPIVATKLYAVTGDGRKMVWPRTEPTEPLSEYLFCRNTWSYGDAVLQTSTLMAPRALFMRIAFSEALKKRQDYDWLLRAAGEHDVRVILVDSPLAIWKIWYDGTSVSNRADWQFSRDWVRARMGMITPRAFAGFLATDVVSEARDQRAWGQFFPLLGEILWRGRPRFFDLALFFASWVPAGTRRWISGLLRA